MKPTVFILILCMIIIISCKTVPPEEGSIIAAKESEVLYRIVAFDGGGIKGVIAAKILYMLTQEVPESLYLIDLYAGTSTGGIIALLLSHGKSPAEVLDFYLKNGSRIFTSYPVKAGFDRGLDRPFYTNHEFKKLLEEQFTRNPALSSLQTDIVVTSFFLDENGLWSPVLFHNFMNSPFNKDRVVDVALRSSAVPVYFPAYQGYIDGGVFANNPSLVALSIALDNECGNVELDTIRLLSLGTGTAPFKIEKKDEDWGAAQWINPYGTPAVPLLKILMDRVSESDDFQCRQILGDHYKRFDILLKKDFPIDDWENVPDLVKEVETYVKKHPDEWQGLIQWIKDSFT